MENKIKQLRAELFEESNKSKELLLKLETYETLIKDTEKTLNETKTQLSNATLKCDSLNSEKNKVDIFKIKMYYYT